MSLEDQIIGISVLNAARRQEAEDRDELLRGISVAVSYGMGGKPMPTRRRRRVSGEDPQEG